MNENSLPPLLVMVFLANVQFRPYLGGFAALGRSLSRLFVNTNAKTNIDNGADISMTAILADR